MMMMMMMMMMFGCAPWILTLLILLFGLVLYLYIPYWKVRRVPGPPLTPIVGHLPLLLKHGPDVFNALAKEYGPIFRFHMGRQPLIIIADPELCREVCIKKFKDIPNRSKIPPASGSPLHEKNLFLSRDSKWSTMRNTIVALYQPSHLSHLIPIMQSFIDSTMRNLTTTKEEEDITFSKLSLMLAIDVLGQAAFGVDFGLSKGDSKSIKGDEVSRFIDAHIYSIQCLKMDMSGSLSIQLGLLFPFLQTPLRKFLRWIPWTTDHRMRLNEKKLCERLAQLIAIRASDKDHSSLNMLSVVLNVRDSKDIFTPDYVMGLAYEHLLAGSATTSFTLSMAIYLVSKHPEVEEKLIREIDGFGDHNVTADDLQSKFPFVDQVIKETMRFRSVSPLVARETNKAVEIGGYILPKGTWVWPALGVPAKDPKHFPEPHLFRPERFDPECEEQKRRHPYAHIPFGIGPRACLGQKLALQELKLSLISIYRRFIFRHSDSMEDPLEFEYGLVVDFKHGIKLRVIKRDNQ